MKTLPKKVDLRKDDIPIYDQGGLGSSSACAIASLSPISSSIVPLYGPIKFLYYKLKKT
jgi:homoserine kinase